MDETALTITLAQAQLLSIVHSGASDQDTAVLIVVGGPQYRVGSHRQFIQLARYLARHGITVMRFDSRGMGDSEADKQSFEDLHHDIESAINALQGQSPGISQVVIWGLCDAASAALLYAHQDSRVCGLVLLNPWLRNEQAMAKTMVKHYYLKRLLSRNFWRKLLKGKVSLAASAHDAKNLVQSSLSNTKPQPADSYQSRMLTGLQAYQGELCLILSGQDLSAKEFEQQTRNNQDWCKLYRTQHLYRLNDADHTFSCASAKREVEQITLKFCQELGKS